jgi:hypothetical protein
MIFANTDVLSCRSGFFRHEQDFPSKWLLVHQPAKN